VHRARYRGPSFEQTPAARMAAATGVRRLTTRGSLLGRRLLLPDPEVAWLPDAGRAALRVVREHGIDAVLTTSPPASAHLIGALVARRTGIPWVADVRDSLLAHPHRTYDRRTQRLKRATEERILRRALGRAGAVTAVTPFIRDEAAALAPRRVPVEVIANGCDFSAFEGLVHTPSPRLRIVHTGSFFGQRSPRPFCEALRALLEARPDLLGRIEARFLGELRPDDQAWAGTLGLGDALRLDGFVPHSQALAAMKDADVLLLLVPRAGGRGLSVLSGKVYEYLAAERPLLALVPPEGAAAALVRDTSAGIVADPDDVPAITAALGRLADDWEAGRLEAPVLSPQWRERLDRRTRAAELAGVLRRLLALRSPAR
jgi:glycosyltransferase involved in cell wall biosynthesis